MADMDGLSPEAQAALASPEVDQAFAELEEGVDTLVLHYAAIRTAYREGMISLAEVEARTNQMSEELDTLDKETIGTLLLEAVTRLGDLGPALALSAHSEIGNAARARFAAQKES